MRAVRFFVICENLIAFFVAWEMRICKENEEERTENNDCTIYEQYPLCKCGV